MPKEMIKDGARIRLGQITSNPIVVHVKTNLGAWLGHSHLCLLYLSLTSIDTYFMLSLKINE